MAEEKTNLKTEIEQAILHFDVKAARSLIGKLNQLMSQSKLSAEQEKSIEKVKAQLSIIAIRFQSDETIEQLLLTYPKELASVFDKDELINKFNARLNHEFFIEDRNRLRDRWNNALIRSQQRVGSQPIRLGSELVEPIVENWIKLFITDVGNGAVSNVKRASFYAKNPAIAQLATIDRSIIRKILSLYEFLKLRSDQPESLSGQFMIEDSSGKIQLLTKDDATPLYDENTIRDLRQKADAGELSAKEIIELRIALPEQFGKYPVPIKTPPIKKDASLLEQSAAAYFNQMQTTYPPITPSTNSRVQVSSIIKNLYGSTDHDTMIAELMSLFQDQANFAKFIRDKKVQSFIAEYSSKDTTEVSSSVSPKMVQQFFEALFIKKYELSQEESLWRTYQVLQYLPASLSEIRTIVSYDIKKKQLAWRY